MKYTTIKYNKISKIIKEFEKVLKEVLKLDISFNWVKPYYMYEIEITKDIFHERNSFMEDILGYGYKEKTFGKHIKSSDSNFNFLCHSDVYRYSFTDEKGVRYIILFKKEDYTELSTKVKNTDYKIKIRISPWEV